MQPEPAPAFISALLQQDEELLWWDQPSLLNYVGGGLVITVPLGLIAVGSAVSWIGWMAPEDLPGWTIAVLAMVLIFAAHMLLLRPLLSFGQARKTYYAVTDKRALVLCHARKQLLQQLPHDQIDLLVIPGAGNRGKIKFGRIASSSLDVLIFGRAAIPGFYGLRDLSSVLPLLRQQRGKE